MNEWYSRVSMDSLSKSQKKLLACMTVIEVLQFCKQYGGANLYIPKNEQTYINAIRNIRICEEFRNGSSAAQLALKYGLTETTIYGIVKAGKGVSRQLADRDDIGMSSESWYALVQKSHLTKGQQSILTCLSIQSTLRLCAKFGGRNLYVPTNDAARNRTIRNKTDLKRV